MKVLVKTSWILFTYVSCFTGLERVVDMVVLED